MRKWTLLLTSPELGLVGKLGETWPHSPAHYERVDVADVANESPSPIPATEGALWSFMLGAMTAAIAIHQDYVAGRFRGHEAFRAHLEAEAAARAQALAGVAPALARDVELLHAMKAYIEQAELQLNEMAGQLNCDTAEGEMPLLYARIVALLPPEAAHQESTEGSPPHPTAAAGVCTDPDNCKRCKAPSWDKHSHAHAGIPLFGVEAS